MATIQEFRYSHAVSSEFIDIWTERTANVSLKSDGLSLKPPIRTQVCQIQRMAHVSLPSGLLYDGLRAQPLALFGNLGKINFVTSA